MIQNTLKYIIILGVISVAGIFIAQFFFLKNSYDFTENQFQENTTTALKDVAHKIIDYNNKVHGLSTKLNTPNPVDQIKNNYYIVNVNDNIDGEILKFHLTEELKKKGINTDFEFGIYDCDNDKMVYGAYVCANADSCEHTKTLNLPKSSKYTYYFGVNFPDRSPYFYSHLKGWYLFTLLLLVVILFFGYTLSVIIKQRQLSEIQKNFINNLTHELKTPISSISLSAKVINEKNIVNTPKRLFEYARIIKEQNDRLSKNVEKVLHLASLEKNKIVLKTEEFILANQLQEILNEFNNSIQIRSTVNIIKLEDSIKIKADKFHFSHVVLNILENAAKYCTTDPVIEISVKSKKKLIAISISDNGIGIPKEVRKKIFQKFYRVPTGNVHDVKGFGLGLDYVKKIVKAHGWQISVDSNLPNGSIFTLLIPSL